MNSFACIFVFLISLQRSFAQEMPDLYIDSAGQLLKTHYLHMNVEHLWAKGWRINWETGISDTTRDNNGKRTHCGSFVAATCKQLDIYILRPPEHGTHLLSNAMYDWLPRKEARRYGWVQINDDDYFKVFYKAQKLADNGYVTVAVFKNEDEEKPGHIALIMPEQMTYEQLKKTGPMLIQAGGYNSSETPLNSGFRKRIHAWPERRITFYYNTHKIN